MSPVDPPEQWPAVVPELSVSDFEASLAFYCRAGFVVRRARTEPAFAYLVREQAHLMIEADHPEMWEDAPLDAPRGRGINLTVEVSDIKAVHAAVGSASQAPQERWYVTGQDSRAGELQVLVRDPDGYLLRFVQVLAETDGRHGCRRVDVGRCAVVDATGADAPVRTPRGGSR